MASLNFREKKLLEEFLEMGGGYVLNLSDRTFADFFRDFDVEIDDAQYLEGHSGSKANGIHRFWDRAPNGLVGKVLQELVDYGESYRPGHPGADGCRAIATRLQTVPPALVKNQPGAAYSKQEGSRPPIATRPIDIFFSYAHEDEALMDVVRLQLVVRESLGEIVKWHDRIIPPGDEWRTRSMIELSGLT
jgi:hypothetical protein